MSKFDPQIHHRRSIRLKGYNYSLAGAYFVTVVTWHRESLFGEIVNGEMRLNKYGEIVQKWWNDIPVHFPSVETGAFVIMPNHVHGIILIMERRGTVPVPKNGINMIPVPDIGTNTNPLSDGDISNDTQGGETPPLPTLGQIIAYFKYKSTKEMNLLDNTGTVTKFWQRNYVSHVLCGITNTSYGMKKTCATKQNTSLPIPYYGNRMTKTRSTYKPWGRPDGRKQLHGQAQNHYRPS